MVCWLKKIFFIILFFFFLSLTSYNKRLRSNKLVLRFSPAYRLLCKSVTSSEVKKVDIATAERLVQIFQNHTCFLADLVPHRYGPLRPKSASGFGVPGGPNLLVDMVSPRGFGPLIILFEERKYNVSSSYDTHLRV